MPPKARKPRAPKERPPGLSNAQWAADVDRRQIETSGRAERGKKLSAKRAAEFAQDEQARKISMAMSMGHARGGGAAQFPGQWPIQGTSSSPSTFSPSSFSPSPFSPSSPAMFQEATYGQTSRFTPSPPELAVDNLNKNQYEGISPALRRGPLPFGAMAAPNDEVIHEMINSGSMAAAASPGFFTQEEARATAAVAARNTATYGTATNEWVEDVADGSQAVEEEEEQPTQAEVADDNLPSRKKKSKKERKKDSPPAEPRIKWTGKEEECLAEAWMTVSMNGITGANQSYDTYWLRVKQAFDERKLVDPYFNKTIMNRGDKVMGTHWGIIQTACSKWHGIQEEIDARPESGADFEQKMRRAFDMYQDDTGLTFKFLNVFSRIEKCEKWAETRKNLAKSKNEQYNPDAPAPGSSDGRPELGQKKLKDLKMMGHPAKRMQASFDKCWADARTHAAGRDDKFDGRWREMLANQGAQIALLKTTATAKKRNTDLAFLMGGNTDLMDEETSIWYEGHRTDILRPTPASSSSSPAPTSSSSPSTTSTAAASTSTAAAATSAAASTTACEETGPSDTAVPGGTADAPVSV